MSKYRTFDSEWSSLREKIEHYLDKSDPNGCWIWTRGKDPQGYGLVSWGGRSSYVHRTYLIELGHEYPDGWVTDHLCRVTSCANPEHLEIVTRRENVIRGVGPTAVNAVKTHCDNGHEFTPENTSTRPNGGRYCRACWRETWHKRKARHAKGMSLSGE